MQLFPAAMKHYLPFLIKSALFIILFLKMYNLNSRVWLRVTRDSHQVSITVLFARRNPKNSRNRRKYTIMVRMSPTRDGSKRWFTFSYKAEVWLCRAGFPGDKGTHSRQRETSNLGTGGNEANSCGETIATYILPASTGYNPSTL